MKSFVFGLLIVAAFCIDGIIIPPPNALDSKMAKCLKDAGVKFALVRVYTKDAEVDKNAVANINLARKEGLGNVFAFVYTTMYTTPEDQVKAVAAALKSTKVDGLFIDIESSQWREFKQMNVDTIKELYARYTKAGFKVGIIGTKHMWDDAFGSFQMNDGKMPLIYESVNGKADFKDYKAFGGWRQPNGKHYVNKKMCDIEAQLVYSP